MIYQKAVQAISDAFHNVGIMFLLAAAGVSYFARR